MRKLFITICSILISISTFAQNTDSTKNANPDWVVRPQQNNSLSSRPAHKAPPEWTTHMKYGGNFALSYWNGAFVEVSPMAGYKLNEKGTITGLGINMIYMSNQFTGYSSFDYGFRAFIQQKLFNFLSLQGEVEAMNARSDRFVDAYDPQNASMRKWEVYPQVGLVFYPSKIRGDYDGTSYYISIMYNLSYPNAGYLTPYYLGNGLTFRIGYF